MELKNFYKGRKDLVNVSEKIDLTDVYDPYLDIKSERPIMIIGEAPGETEVLNGKPFCGPSGSNLEKLISFNNMDRTRDFLITNIFPFRTREKGRDGWINRTPNTKELKEGSLLLEQEIKIVKPRAIILLGGTALNGIRFIEELKTVFAETNRGELREVVLFGMDIVVGHSYHPSPIAYNRPTIKEGLFDFFGLIKERLF